MLQPLEAEVRSRLRSGIAITSVSQCVEELLLNSLDAGATCAALRVDLNSCRIQVVDNGCGLEKDQLESVAERYCTSKCHTVQDLDNLIHFGYRGEALASIRNMCAIMEIESRSKKSTLTYCRIFHNTRPLPVTQCKVHRPSSGTTVTIHDLFAALPVRRKSMNMVLELERIRQRVEAIAIVHPGISLSLRNEATGSKLLQTHKSSSVLGAFTHLFGTSKSRHLCEVSAKEDIFQINGYISKEGHYNKSLQFMYVNDRLVLKTCLHKLMHYLVGKSLIVKRRSGTPKTPVLEGTPGGSPQKLTDRHGVFVLNITCPLSEYDITFDPTKTLVEFKNWQALQKCVQDMVHDFLKRENLTLSFDVKDDGGTLVDVQSLSDDDVNSQEDTSTKSLDEIEETPIDDSSEITDNMKRYGNTISTTNMLVNLQSKTAKRTKFTEENKEDESFVVSSTEPSTVPETQFEEKGSEHNKGTDPGELLSAAVTESTSSSQNVAVENSVPYVRNPKVPCSSQSPLAFMYQSSEDPTKTQIPPELDKSLEEVVEEPLKSQSKCNIISAMSHEKSNESSTASTFVDAALTVSQLLQSDDENHSDDDTCVSEETCRHRDHTFISLASTAACSLSSLESFKCTFKPLPSSKKCTVEQKTTQCTSMNLSSLTGLPKGLTPLVKLRKKFQGRSCNESDGQCSSSLAEFQHKICNRKNIMKPIPGQELLLSSFDKIRERLQSGSQSRKDAHEGAERSIGRSGAVSASVTSSSSHVTAPSQETSLHSHSDYIRDIPLETCNVSPPRNTEEVLNCNLDLDSNTNTGLSRKRCSTCPSDSDSKATIPLASKLAKLSRKKGNMCNTKKDSDIILHQENYKLPMELLGNSIPRRSNTSKNNEFNFQFNNTSLHGCSGKGEVTVETSSKSVSKTRHVFQTSESMLQTAQNIDFSEVIRSLESSQESYITENVIPETQNSTTQQQGNVIACFPEKSSTVSIITKEPQSSASKIEDRCFESGRHSPLSDNKEVIDINRTSDTIPDNVFNQYQKTGHGDGNEGSFDSFHSQLYNKSFSMMSNPSVPSLSNLRSNVKLFVSPDFPAQKQDQHMISEGDVLSGKLSIEGNIPSGSVFQDSGVNKEPFSLNSLFASAYDDINQQSPWTSQVTDNSSHEEQQDDNETAENCSRNITVKCKNVKNPVVSEYSDYSVEFTALRDMDFHGMEYSSQSSVSLVASDIEDSEQGEMDGAKGNRTPNSDISVHSLGFSVIAEGSLNPCGQSQGFSPAQHPPRATLDVMKQQIEVRESQGFWPRLVEESERFTPEIGTLPPDSVIEPHSPSPALCNNRILDAALPGSSLELPNTIEESANGNVNAPETTSLVFQEPLGHRSSQASEMSRDFMDSRTDNMSQGFNMGGPETQAFDVGVRDISQNDSGIVQDICPGDVSLQVYGHTTHSVEICKNVEGGMSSEDVVPQLTTNVEVALQESTENNSEKVIFTSTSWICKLDKSGRNIFINRVTGNTSYDNPMADTSENTRKNPPSFSVTQSHPLLDHDIPSNLLRSRRGKVQTSSSSILSPASKVSLDEMWDQHQESQDAGASIKWREGQCPLCDSKVGDTSVHVRDLFKNWDNPSFTHPDKEVVNLDASTSSKSSNLVQKAIHPHKFTKDVFKTVEVLGQVDNKFIACLATVEKKHYPSGCRILIVVDQHAAHERVRLERLTQESYGSDGVHVKSTDVTPAIDITLTQEDVRIMTAYRTGMMKIGIGFTNDAIQRDTVSIHSVPACFIQREASERKRKRSPVAMDLLESLIKEQVELLKMTNGASAVLPKAISNVLNSQACHGAIKFGDPLTHGECKQLLKELSACKLPFQCAHGRPSLMPVLDLDEFQIRFPPEVTRKPCLWKLRQRMMEECDEDEEITNV